MIINEIFQSLQGEGPSIGEPATFIRLSGCNLSCRYCDTRHDSGKELSMAEIIGRVQEGPARVIITGGEPLLAGDGLVGLARAIAATGRTVDIETNGTIAPPGALAAYIDNYVISPKLSRSGSPAESRELAEGLPAGPLKFAIADPEELDEVKAVAAKMPGRQVIVMPLGTDLVEMIATMERLRPAVEACGWRLLPRLHVLLGLR